VKEGLGNKRGERNGSRTRKRVRQRLRHSGILLMGSLSREKVDTETEKIYRRVGAGGVGKKVAMDGKGKGKVKRGDERKGGHIA